MPGLWPEAGGGVLGGEAEHGNWGSRVGTNPSEALG